MKKVLIFLLLFVGVKAYSQVPFEMGATKHDSLSIGGKWLTSVSQDSTLAGVDSNAVVTEYAVKKYIDNNVNTLSGVAAVSDSVKALYDTAAVHLDTMQLHDVRIKALHAWVLDSVARLTDTTQLHDTRLKNLSAEIDAVGTGVVDDTIKFSNGSYVTIPVSGNSIILGTANEHSLIGELEAGVGYLSYLSTDVVRLAPISDKPSVLQYGMLVVDQADTNLYIYKTGGWTLVGGSGSGTGDVNVSGTTAANTIAYWNGADSTLVSDDVVKLYADSAVFTEPVVMHDSTYLMGQGVDLSDVWWGGTGNGAMDTGHVENAWYGLVHALDNPMAYLNDTKEVEGHLELKVWYIDDKTGEPAFQYGIKGLSPTEAATAFQINHEFMTRYVADHEARLQKLEQATKQDTNLGLDIKFLIGLVIFVSIMGLIITFRK